MPPQPSPEGGREEQVRRAIIKPLRRPWVPLEDGQSFCGFHPDRDAGKGYPRDPSPAGKNPEPPQAGSQGQPTASPVVP